MFPVGLAHTACCGVIIRKKNKTFYPEQIFIKNERTNEMFPIAGDPGGRSGNSNGCTACIDDKGIKAIEGEEGIFV